jgi:DNA-binding transcriptional ArsR family regulator
VPNCEVADHPARERCPASAEALERASRIFRALGDASRLRLMELLAGGESCVTELVQTLGEKMSTVSQRLRLLRSEGLVRRRREGTHLFYALADEHVLDMVHNALAHAAELEDGPGHSHDSESTQSHDKENAMSSHHHAGHDHQHGPSCGHTAVKHNGHVDYVHDGHLHHPAGGQVEEHALEVGGSNPAGCTPKHACSGHAKTHTHGPTCGHEAVPHGDHVDYLVEGHLHHPHGDHCDDHGPVDVVK